MAITFGNTSNNASQGTTTWSHDSDGDFLLVAIEATTAVTGVTYNSVAMTQIGTNLSHPGYSRVMNIWGLVNPASGSNNIVLSGGANQNATVTSMSGVDQTTPTSGFNSNYQSSTTDGTVAITTTVADAYAVAFFLQQAGSAGTDTTLVTTSFVPYQGLIRSTSAVSSPGSITLHWSSILAPSGLLGAGINPATAPTVNAGAFFAFM